MYEMIDLSFNINGKNILNQISLTFPNKKFIGLIGPNGSGKSTLLKCLYRQIQPSHGQIFYKKKALDQWGSKEFAKEIGVMGQENHIHFDFSVKEIVEMGRYVHTKEKGSRTINETIIDEVLADFDLIKFKDQSFLTLSGGEKQRVLIARALVQETQTLILDEPTNHLDISHQLDLMTNIKNLDKTVIIALHDLNYAWRYCDLLLVLKNGSVYSYDKIENLDFEKIVWEVFDVRSKVVDVDGVKQVVLRSTMPHIVKRRSV